jgi:hypothetical protein
MSHNDTKMQMSLKRPTIKESNNSAVFRLQEPKPRFSDCHRQYGQQAFQWLRG